MYRTYRKALEEGFTHQYDWIVQHFWGELREELCKEVWDIFEMYQALQFSYRKLEGEDKGDMTERDICFQGYDGNDEVEGHLMSYARYIVEDLDRYTDLIKSSDMNSHMPMLEDYRKMLGKWRAVEKRQQLSANEIKSILSAS
jgi:hypothetical protein